MNWRGDTDSGCTVAGSFTTVTTTGAPTVLTGTAGSVCLVAYRLNPGDATGFTCSTAGITLATNCSGRTGWNTWAVNTASDLGFYTCGHDYELVLQGGTVGGTCVSGYQVAGFSLKNRSGLRPTVPGRTLDVDASGRVLTQPCSTVHSVTSVINNVPGVTAGVTVTTNNDKTGYALSAAGVDCVGFTTIPEPANVPGWPMSLRTALGWLLALGTNCVTQTAAVQSVCNRANNATLASADITCSSTIVHRGNFA